MPILPNLLTTLNVGTTPNDGTGDQLREGMIKINNNLAQIVTRVGVGQDLQLRLDSNNSVVSGDINGNNCQTVSLTLSPTSVVAGTYANPINLAVDAKGRITSISNINLPDGTYQFPILTVSNGRISNISENTPGFVRPNDTVGGDLTGTYSSPTVKGLRTVNLSTTLPSIENQVYAFQNNQWVPKTLLEILPPLNGDVQGSYNNNTVTKIRNRNISNIQPTDGQVLTWVASRNEWEPATITQQGPIPDLNGDVSGPIANNTVTKIRNRNVSNTQPTNGQVLAWSQSDNQWQPTTLAPASVGLGTAGGDLEGSYPNPNVVRLRGTLIDSSLSPNIGDILVWDGNKWRASKPMTPFYLADCIAVIRAQSGINYEILSTQLTRQVEFSLLDLSISFSVVTNSGSRNIPSTIQLLKLPTNNTTTLILDRNLNLPIAYDYNNHHGRIDYHRLSISFSPILFNQGEHIKVIIRLSNLPGEVHISASAIVTGRTVV
jgi:hypothetical protein